MSVVVKLDALNALAAAIAAAVPALVGKITIQQEPPATIESFPNLSIILAGRPQFSPADRELQQDLGGGVVVWNVGAWEAPLQMRLVTTNKIDRAKLEQQIVDYALSREGAPGIVVVPVVSATSIHWTAAFELEDNGQWMDQRVIEREFETVLTFNAVIPALTVQSNVYQIDKLVLGLTSDFTTQFTPTTFAPPAVELVVINQDGTLSTAA